MSCYEWERGTIKIPARQWKSFVENFLHVKGETVDPKASEVFELGDGNSTIRTDADNTTVFWNVYEGNHACEEARKHETAKALFRALDRVVWTRGSGGDIVGNDEYNRDSCSLGGSGNYLVTRYGPQKKRRGLK